MKKQWLFMLAAICVAVVPQVFAEVVEEAQNVTSPAGIVSGISTPLSTSDFEPAKKKKLKNSAPPLPNSEAANTEVSPKPADKITASANAEKEVKTPSNTVVEEGKTGQTQEKQTNSGNSVQNHDSQDDHEGGEELEETDSKQIITVIIGFFCLGAIIILAVIMSLMFKKELKEFWNGIFKKEPKDKLAEKQSVHSKINEKSSNGDKSENARFQPQVSGANGNGWSTVADQQDKNENIPPVPPVLLNADKTVEQPDAVAEESFAAQQVEEEISTAAVEEPSAVESEQVVENDENVERTEELQNEAPEIVIYGSILQHEDFAGDKYDSHYITVLDAKLNDASKDANIAALAAKLDQTEEDKNKEINDLENKLSDKNKELKTKGDEIEYLTSKLTEKGKELKEKDNEIGNLEGKLTGKNKELEEKARKIGDLEGELINKKNELTQKNADIETKNGEIQVLTEAKAREVKAAEQKLTDAFPSVAGEFRNWVEGRYCSISAQLNLLIFSLARLELIAKEGNANYLFEELDRFDDTLWQYYGKNSTDDYAMLNTLREALEPLCNKLLADTEYKIKWTPKGVDVGCDDNYRVVDD